MRLQFFVLICAVFISVVTKQDDSSFDFREMVQMDGGSVLDTIPEERLLLTTDHEANKILTEVEASHSGGRSRDRNFQAHHKSARQAAIQKVQIIGFRVENDIHNIKDGVPVLQAGSQVTLRMFGIGFSNRTRIGLTAEKLKEGGKCNAMVSKGFHIVAHDSSSNVRVEVLLPERSMQLFICASDGDETFLHQGSESWMSFNVFTPFMPVWGQIVIILICLSFSALFSGLNLGLMSLDQTDLKILCNTGTEDEKRYARAIQPVRDQGNFLLCSILLGNVLVNSTFTILLDSLTSGLIAVVCSTLLIVFIGEIGPQAICSRHGLKVGAKTIIITRFVMLVTFPLSYPTSKILDCLLGEEIGTYYNRERLNELVKVTKEHNDLKEDEVNVISGVLQLRKKTASDIMTPISDAFMLSVDSLLNFETMTNIMNSGYSRIPVFENNRTNITSLLYIKDLAFIDTEDNFSVRKACAFARNPCHFIFDDTTLDVLLQQFKEGHSGHMAIVQQINENGDNGAYLETVGLVTLEDVIEELIQAEIMDETDRITDNKTKKRRSRLIRQERDYSVFADRRSDSQKVHISPQLTLAAFQFMSTTFEPFQKPHVSETILRRLLNQDITRHIKLRALKKNDPDRFIFQKGQPVDFFVLILEGRVAVTVGDENLVFESGPFSQFGLQALGNESLESPQQMNDAVNATVEENRRYNFVPDYTVEAISDVVYIVVTRNIYLAAKRATQIEESRHQSDDSQETFDEDVEKLLISFGPDEASCAPRVTFLLPSQSMQKLAEPTENLSTISDNKGENCQASVEKSDGKKADEPKLWELE